MTNISVSLPQGVKEFVDARVAEGGFRDTGDYGLALIEQDRARGAASTNETEDELRAQLRAGAEELARGDFVSFDRPTEILDDIERRGRERIARRKGK